MGGEVRIQSEVGRGSAFTLLVPAGDPEEREASARPERRSYRLLVVDDNEVNLEYMAAILANAGHSATTALSGAQALRLLEETPPDAAILDIQMPGMSGIELGRKIREYGGNRYDSGIPLVALTAFDPVEVSRSGVDFDGVFDKPVDVPKLLGFLDEAVDRREAPSREALAARWSGKMKEGARARAEAGKAAQGASEKLLAAVAAGEGEAVKAAARELGALMAKAGDERDAAALRRLALAFAEERRAVVSSRASRIAANCALSLEILASLFHEA
jgi:CheY-like chemotaxis protein